MILTNIDESIWGNFVVHVCKSMGDSEDYPDARNRLLNEYNAKFLGVEGRNSVIGFQNANNLSFFILRWS